MGTKWGHTWLQSESEGSSARKHRFGLKLLLFFVMIMGLYIGIGPVDKLCTFLLGVGKKETKVFENGFLCLNPRFFLSLVL